MKSARIPRILLYALLASPAVWAAPAGNQGTGAAGAVVSGVYEVAFYVDTGSVAPAGGAITCKAKIAPNLPAQGDMNRGPAPVESAAGVVKLAGSGPAASPVLCLVEIPFAWRVTNRGSGAWLRYEIVAASGSGAVAAQTGQGIGVPFPEAGGSASVRLNVAF